MKYRTKLYIALVAIASVSILLAILIFSFRTEKLVFNILKSRSITVVATAASQMNPQLFAEANKATSISDPIYQQAADVLRNILNANRRDDLFVSEVYTLYPDPNNPNQLIWGVDSDPFPTPPGTIYNFSDKDLILKNLNQDFADPKFTTDQYGVWLSGFSPIRDADGNYIATLAVDINAGDIHDRIKELVKFAVWGLLCALTIAIVIAHILSKKVTKSLHYLTGVVKQIGSGNFQARSNLASKDEFGELSEGINAMSKGLQERERLKMSFARYVSTHILDKILHSESPLKLEGERRKVTMLFSDIRQFTRIAETHPPEEVVNLLNDYFERMIEVIFTHSGTLDKFTGDGIMAEFGAPLDDASQEEHAVLTAIQMHKELNKLCDKWELQKRPRIQMGIGIHTGEAVVGNIGSEKRIEYTAIGDTVNVAARLEQATKMLNVPLLLSESTYLKVKDKFPFKDLGLMALPGRKEQIRVYTIDLDKI
ncbi:MAG: HAMP domain-containing protein [Verrucomicrobia bacterium]|nr:HAMP domain-containing protein [Verrucomicrobiota bacterium]